MKDFHVVDKKRPEMVIKRPFVIKIRFETVYKRFSQAARGDAPETHYRKKEYWKSNQKMNLKIFQYSMNQPNQDCGKDNLSKICF